MKVLKLNWVPLCSLAVNFLGHQNTTLRSREAKYWRWKAIRNGCGIPAFQLPGFMLESHGTNGGYVTMPV